MSSLLNPLFLGSIATIALISVVVWQVLAPENQLANNDNFDGISGNVNNGEIPPGFENPESQEGEVAEGEETIDPGFLSQTTSGEEILAPISRQSQQQRPSARGVRLYDQLVGFNLFPDLLPNQGGGGNNPLGSMSPSGPQTAPQFSSYQNQYTQYQYRNSPSSQVGANPSPLGQAVNTVMSNSNYARYVGQRQAQQAQMQQQSQVQGGVYGNGVSPVGNNLNFPSISPTLYGGAPQQGFAPTYGAPSYGAAGVSRYGTASPYGGGGVPYGGGGVPYGGGVGVNPYGASSFSYGGGF